MSKPAKEASTPRSSSSQSSLPKSASSASLTNAPGSFEKPINRSVSMESWNRSYDTGSVASYRTDETPTDHSDIFRGSDDEDSDDEDGRNIESKTLIL